MCGETIGNRDLRERAALPDLDAACAAAGITDGGRCRDRCDLLSIIGQRHALRTEIQMDRAPHVCPRGLVGARTRGRGTRTVHREEGGGADGA